MRLWVGTALVAVGRGRRRGVSCFPEGDKRTECREWRGGGEGKVAESGEEGVGYTLEEAGEGGLDSRWVVGKSNREGAAGGVEEGVGGGL